MADTLPMRSGLVGRLVNCGIPYRVKIRDNELHFFEDGMMRCRVMIIYKRNRHELLQVELTQQSMPACHIMRAAKVAEHFIGPDHFESLAAMHRFEGRNAARNIMRRNLGPGWGLWFRLKCCWWAMYHQWRSRFPETIRIDWENA